MASLTTHDGLTQDGIALGAGPLATATVGLFTTNRTPTLADVLADYTPIEAAWGGYARQNSFPWSPPTIDLSDRAVIFSQLLEFPVTGPPGGALAYGYFVVVSGKIHHAELLALPIVPLMGTPVSVLLRYRVQNV